MKTFFILLHKKKDFTAEVIERHMAYLSTLKQQGRLVLCGPFLDWKGGMVVVRAEDRKQAMVDALADPYVVEGFEHFEIHELDDVTARVTVEE